MDSSPHPFLDKPHRTLINLSIPVLLSLTAEPITALVDTAFIASLGVVPLAGLGAGTIALSTLFWMFNFLGVGTQTETAQAIGRGNTEEAKHTLSLALYLATGFGLLLITLVIPSAPILADWLGATEGVKIAAVTYIRIRIFGAPAILLTLVSFGYLRGKQDMKSPLWVALGVNLLNILLDWLLIFGAGPIPAMGVAGSALASTISQWLGAGASILLSIRGIGLSKKIAWRDSRVLMSTGRDMFFRTLLLNLFLAYTTRSANNLGADAGAAHQIVRQMWVFTALALDAFAASAQSLVGYFMGQGSITSARYVSRIGLYWSLGTGFIMGLLMWLSRDLVIRLMVPDSSIQLFLGAWLISAISQPVNAVSFLTDGVHWGTRDFPYLRNVMILASGLGMLGLWFLGRSEVSSLIWIWILISVWNFLRGLFGLLRIWPGVGKSPLHH
jgi:MATE family multidrug resistance protein